MVGNVLDTRAQRRVTSSPKSTARATHQCERTSGEPSCQDRFVVGHGDSWSSGLCVVVSKFTQTDQPKWRRGRSQHNGERLDHIAANNDLVGAAALHSCLLSRRNSRTCGDMVGRSVVPTFISQTMVVLDRLQIARLYTTEIVTRSRRISLGLARTFDTQLHSRCRALVC